MVGNNRLEQALLMLSILLCHFWWLTLPFFCLFVLSELWFIVDTLIALVGMKLGAFPTRAQINPNRSLSGPTEIPNSFEIPKNNFDFKFCVSWF